MLIASMAGLAFFERVATPDEFYTSTGMAFLDIEYMIRRNIIAEMPVCRVMAPEYPGCLKLVAYDL